MSDRDRRPETIMNLINSRIRRSCPGIRSSRLTSKEGEKGSRDWSAKSHNTDSQARANQKQRKEGTGGLAELPRYRLYEPDFETLD